MRQDPANVEWATRFEPDSRFKDIWLYCMLDHERGGLHSGPCTECIRLYAVNGPPDGRWNAAMRSSTHG